MREKLWKVTGKGGQSCHGGNHDWEKNPTCRVKGKLVPCENGVHALRAKDLVSWLGEEIREVKRCSKERVACDD